MNVTCESECGGAVHEVTEPDEFDFMGASDSGACTVNTSGHDLV